MEQILTVHSLSVRLSAEFLGTMFLLMTVVGSGIMGERLSDGNDAIALLGNSMATGVVLAVLIVVIAPLSGAHFNPAVSFAFALRKEQTVILLALYVVVQVAGGVIGTWIAHLMFEIDWFQYSSKTRTGLGQWLAEVVATFGLVATILGTLRVNPKWVGATVGLYIAGAYWFTASTSFANPAVTIARSMTDTFSGISPLDAPAFILMQFIGSSLAVICFYTLVRIEKSRGENYAPDNDESV